MSNSPRALPGSDSNDFVDGAALWSEPYRPFFLFGGLWGAALLVVWGLRLFQIAGGSVPVAPALGFAEHAHLMIWGVVGSYIFGFSLTAYPKQNEGRPMSRGGLQGLFGLFLVSQLALLVGWGAGPARLASVGKAGELVSYLCLLAFLFPIGAQSLGRQFSWQPLAVLVALATGTLALAVQSFAPAPLAWAALQVALWGYLLPLLAGFAYRLVPFFTSRVVKGYVINRGRWFLPVLVVLLWIRIVAVATGVREPVLLAVNILLLAWALREWLRWAPWRVLRIPLIGVLHLAWIWLLGAFAVGALQATSLVSLRETHPLTVGCLLTFVLGISTRVTLGHGGRPLQMGAIGVAVIAAAQLAALVRVLGPLHHSDIPLVPPAVSAFVMAGAFALWLARFGPYLVLPKVPPEKLCPK